MYGIPDVLRQRQEERKMSRYSKKMTEIIDSIFEGYTLNAKGKLVIKNESASKKAVESLHTLVLEKSRDLWDQLEAAEGSLADVAEEIRFEEMNTDPSSMSGAVTHAAAATDEDAAAVDAAPTGLDQASALESAQSIGDLLGSADLNLDDIFEDNFGDDNPMRHLDGDIQTNAPEGPSLPFDEDGGTPPTAGGMGYDPRNSGVSSQVVAGEEGDEMDDGGDYDELSVGMGDEGGDMGMDDMGMGDEFGDEGGDVGMSDEFGDEGGMDDMGDENGDMGFDFDLDLDGDFGDENGDLGLGDEGEEEYEEGMGHQDKSYRMEGKGDDDKDDDDDDDDDKPAFLKKGKKDDDDDDDDDKDDDDKPAFLKKKKDKDD
jgi:hypothetical protein